MPKCPACLCPLVNGCCWRLAGKREPGWTLGLPPVRIAVNVSALQFAAKDFLSSVRAALISTGMDPHNLELELTETVLMQDAEIRGANPTCPESHRRATSRRRFWSGLFRLQLSAKIPTGCFESRPQLYKRHFFQPSQCHHLERAHRHRKEPESARGRRRRGDRGTIALSPKTKVAAKGRVTSSAFP
jgi:hypothetical protein